MVTLMGKEKEGLNAWKLYEVWKWERKNGMNVWKFCEVRE